jgi:hypothetical protein
VVVSDSKNNPGFSVLSTLRRKGKFAAGAHTLAVITLFADDRTDVPRSKLGKLSPDQHSVPPSIERAISEPEELDVGEFETMLEVTPPKSVAGVDPGVIELKSR